VGRSTRPGWTSTPGWSTGCWRRTSNRPLRCTTGTCRSRYPQDLLDDLRHLTDWSFIREGDARLIGVPIDALGVNYYTPALVAAGPANGPGHVPFQGTDLAHHVPQDGPYTAMDWRIEPAAMTELLLRLHRDYPDVPLVITENGAAYDDVVTPDGQVHDAERTEYLRAHLGAVHDAIKAGVDVRGYYLWSLMDNFEWAWGYSKRFGIVHVDFATQRRTVKESGRWYSAVVAANALD
jgi:beta-glucosidase